MNKGEQIGIDRALARLMAEPIRPCRRPTAHRQLRFHDMLLAHRIQLAPTPAQRDYFARAAGTARRVWNWALAEWQRQLSAGQRPNAMALKKQFNAIKYSDPGWLDADGQSWLRTIHRDAHAQPFAHLAEAWNRYFAARREKQAAHPPVFKKKGRCRDSFYVANDKLRLDGMVVVLPKVGRVALRETLRWTGKIMGASVSREADRWYLAVQVEVPEQVAHCSRSGDGITGVDLGISAAATLSSGEKIAAPRPLEAALRRLRVRGRRQSRKLKAAKAAAGIRGRIPKGTRLPVSKKRTKGARALARLHARIAHARMDFMHKLTTRLCRENQTVVIEDLNVSGMLANARLSRAINLQRLATGAFAAQSALPVASPAATSGTVAGMVPAGVGKVTPARYEHGQQDGSGQEENGAHF
jgi:putative transposase